MCPSGPSCLTYTGSHRPCSQNPTQSIQPPGCVRVSDDFTFASVAALIINHGNSLHSKLEAGPSQLGLILFHRGVTQVPDRPTPRECHLVCSRPYASIQSCFATSHPLPIFLPPATVSYPLATPHPSGYGRFRSLRASPSTQVRLTTRPVSFRVIPSHFLLTDAT